jgi:DNA-binding transcriptional regulator YhcF (GntR family)
MEERVRRSEQLERATREREAHSLVKATWTKAWKRRDEYFAELIARLTREAGTGVDEGGQQLSIPGTEPELPPDPTPEPSPPSRWDELARVEPPRLTVWTLQEADLSPVATRLLTLLRPVDQDGVARRVRVLLDALPDLLDCTAAEALDAAAELLCLDLAKNIGGQELATGDRRDGLLRLDSWYDRDEAECGLAVLRAMLQTRKPLLHADELLLETKLPRRVLLPLLRGLTALGAVECIEGEAEGETYWRRVARVPLWEGLALEALRRAEGVEHLAKRAVVGCIDLDWAICGLVEAGALAKGKMPGQWSIPDKAEPLSLDDIKAKIKAKVAARGATRSDRRVSVDELARDFSLQIPTMQRACEALAAEGYLVAITKPGDYSGYAAGPWYKRAEEKADKKAKAKGKTSKGKAQPKNTAKHGKKDMLAQKRVEPAPARDVEEMH